MTRYSVAAGLALSILLLAWPEILHALFPDYTKSYVPELVDHLPMIAAIWLVPNMKDGMAKTISIVWLGWYFVGTLNTMASALFLGSHYAHLPLADAARVYGLGCLMYFAGVLLAESCLMLRADDSVEKVPPPIVSKANPLVYRALTAFPFAWLVSLYLSVGFIPALSGLDITSEIYETNYGPLYPYTAVLAISALCFYAQNVAKGQSWQAWIYVLFVVAISFADGKRVVAMIVAGGLFAILFTRSSKNAWRYTAVLAFMFLCLYVLVQIVRQGGDTERYASDGITKFMAVGVEYRDYVFSMNFLQPGSVPGYSWGASALASMLNESALALLGFRKAELVSQGSAYVWSGLFDSPYGIRTGIVSELWFAYEMLSYIVLIVLGFATSALIRMASHCQDPLNRTILQGTVGLLLLLVMGQTTMIAGTVTVYVYLLVAGWLERWLSAPKRLER